MPKTRPHIVFITPAFPKDSRDSTWVPYLQTYIKALNQRAEFKISIIALQYPRFVGHYQWEGIEVYACGGLLYTYPRKLGAWWRLRRTFKYFNQVQKVDFIHTFWLNSVSLLGNGLSKQYRIPHLITLMGQEVRGNKYIKFVDLDYPTIVGISQIQAAKYEALTKRSLAAILPWGTLPSHFPNSENTNRPYDIIGVGSHIGLKNYELFISLIGDLVKDFPQLNCLLIGEGPLTNHLRQMTQEKKLQSNISLRGHLAREEVLCIMQESKILLHCSEYEAMGYVFAEAAHAGMYIVSFEVGAAEAAAHWKVVKNRREMYEALKSFLQSQLSFKARPIMIVEKLVESYLSIYRDLI